MKKIVSALFAAIVVSLFSGCANLGEVYESETADSINIVCSLFAPYDFAREIAGEAAAVSMLLPPGAESHSFEPTAQDIIKIQNCDVFIYIGGESETWIDDILSTMYIGNMLVVPLIESVNALNEEIVEGMQHPTGHEKENEHGYDEHIWTSPKNAKLMVRRILAALCEADNENATVYEKNALAYLEKLDGIDSSISEAVDGAARNTIVFGDRFPFRYLAEDYGLNYFAAFPGCASETEPSAATVAFLIKKINDENIPCVFHIEMSNEKMADTICAETGAKKLLLHSCHNVSREQLDNGISYISLMESNAANLKEALN